VQALVQPGEIALSRHPAPAAPARVDPYRVVAADFLAGAGPGSSLPAPTQVEIAFAGRSNVGKSSLINALVQRKSLVRTSSTPGSTRQVNLYEARAADGAVFHLVDLPGYGFSHRSKAERASWGALIEGYLAGRVTLAVVVILVDVRRGLEDDDLELIAFIDAAKAASRRPVQIVLVATKLDKVPRSSRKAALARMGDATSRKVFGFSAVTAEGRDELWRTLRRAALGDVVRVTNEGEDATPPACDRDAPNPASVAGDETG
jgi:GTP-binding protein